MFALGRVEGSVAELLTLLLDVADRFPLVTPIGMGLESGNHPFALSFFNTVVWSEIVPVDLGFSLHGGVFLSSLSIC